MERLLHIYQTVLSVGKQTFWTLYLCSSLYFCAFVFLCILPHKRSVSQKYFYCESDEKLLIWWRWECFHSLSEEMQMGPAHLKAHLGGVCLQWKCRWDWRPFAQTLLCLCSPQLVVWVRQTGWTTASCNTRIKLREKLYLYLFTLVFLCLHILVNVFIMAQVWSQWSWWMGKSTNSYQALVARESIDSKL